MGMTRKLWSLNALATELGIDRRTMGAALDRVPADGTIGKHGAWWLETAVKALERRRRPAPGPALERRRDPAVEELLDHLQHWRDILGARKAPPSIAEVAGLCGREPDDILTWLRAGCPYAVEGDWETGVGFKLVTAWVLDWRIAATVRVVVTGDREADRLLRLGAFDSPLRSGRSLDNASVRRAGVVASTSPAGPTSFTP